MNTTITTPPPGFYIVEQLGQRSLYPLVNGKPAWSHVFAAKDKIDSNGVRLPSYTKIIMP